MSITDAYRNLGIYAPDGIASTEQSTNFHHAALIAAQKLKVAVEAASKISPDLKDEVRLQRQAAALRKARSEFQKAVTEAGRPLQAPIVHLREELAKAARGPASESDPSRALLRHLQVTEVRRQIEGLPESQRGKTLQALASTGNPYILEALDGAIAPLVGQPILDMVRNTYLEATQAPVIQRLEEAEEAEREVLMVLRQLGGFVDKTTKSMGLDAALDVPAPRYAAEMTNSQKSAFIDAHGLEAYQSLIQNGTVPTWTKQHSMERHPQAETMEELVIQVGSIEAAQIWMLEKRLPEGWNPPQPQE